MEKKRTNVNKIWSGWQKNPKMRKVLFGIIGLLAGLLIAGLCMLCYVIGLDRGRKAELEQTDYELELPVSDKSEAVSGGSVSGQAVSGEGVIVSGVAVSGSSVSEDASDEQNPAGGSANDGSGKAGSGNSTSSDKNSGSRSGGSTGAATATAGYVGKLTVSGNKLMANGSPVQLRGVSTHGLSWFPEYVNPTLFAEVKAWGANTIRLAMYTAEYNGYCTGDEANRTRLKELVKKGVQYATEQDMYVIIDWHILSDNNPNTYKSQAIDFFKEMAQLYQNNDHVLYEICNEPNGGTSWSEIKSYATDVIATIRQYDKDGIILIGTPTWSQELDKAVADPITGYDNLMYTLHFYANTHREELRDTLTSAVNAGLPVFVSEFSICDASGNGGINTEQANLWIQTLNRYGISYISWSLCNKAETSALIQSSCSKTSGITEGDLSECGKWLLQTLQGKISIQTVVAKESSDGQTVSGNQNPLSGQNHADNQNSSSAQQTAKSPDSYTPTCSDGMQVSVVNSWQEGNTCCIQYEIQISNVSGQQQNTWKGSMTFPANVTVVSGWNANFTSDGRTVTLTPMDYNKSIPAGGKLEGIGVIVRME